MKRFINLYQTCLILVLSLFAFSANAQTVCGTVPFTIVLNDVSATCLGIPDGEVSVSVTGGVGPFTYLWFDGSTNDTVQNLQVNGYYANPYDYYTVVVTDQGQAETCTDSIQITAPVLVNINATFNLPSSCGSCDGNATAVATNGVGPYDYIWSNGVFHGSTDTSVLTQMCGGSYMVFASDANGCTSLLDSVDLGIYPPYLGLVSITPATCGLADGAFEVTASLGTPPYIYSIDGGLNYTATSVHTGLMAGVYSVVVQDANSCSDTLAVILTSSNPPTITNNPGLLCVNSSAQAVAASPSGGTWSSSCGICIDASSGMFDPNVAGIGVHSITYTSPAGCVETAAISVVDLPTVSIVQTPPSCGQCDGLLEGFSPGFTTYAWFPGIGLSNQTGANPYVCEPAATTTYVLNVTDVNGCSNTANVTVQAGLPCDSIYPGDTDYDGIADNLDLLPIGLQYGNIGGPRTGASLNWVGQVAPNWLDTVPGGADAKHTDTDGNGTINDNDTLAIIQNYGYVHHNNAWVNRAGAGDPYLFFDLALDSTQINQSLTVPLHYGDATTPVDSVYGIAFTVNFDPALVDTTLPINMSFNNTWLGTLGTDALSIQYLKEQQGELDVAITRTDGQPISGFGILGELNVVTTDNLSGMVNANYSYLFFWLSEVKILNADGLPLEANLGVDSIVISDSDFVGVEEQILSKENVLIYPNPATESVVVYLKDGQAAQRITITDLTGRIVNEITPLQSATRMNTSDLKAGVYLVNVFRNGAVHSERLVVLSR